MEAANTTHEEAMSPFSYRRGNLHCENVSLRDVAETRGTPVYVYSTEAIRSRCREIEKAFDRIPHLSCYAVKANANPEILRLIAAEGLGADVGSRGELSLALEAGFPPEKITFSGVGKRDDEIAFAIKKGIHAFCVESSEEVEVINQIATSTGSKARVLVRVNLDIDAGGHAYVSTSRKQNKFGIPRTRVREFLQHAMTLPSIDVRGVHSHIGSQVTDTEVFVRAARLLLALVEDLRANGVPVHDIDFGGGFGVRYSGYLVDPGLPAELPEAEDLDPVTMIRRVLAILRGAGCHLSIQPGRAIVAQAGALLVKVLYRKETGEKTFVIVDGGMNDLLRPSLYGAYHQIVPLMLSNRPHETVDVVGPVCESGDFFAEDRLLPSVHRGDHLALMCAGAYGYVLSSNYNARLRAPEVLIAGSTYRTIREREELRDL